MHSRTGVYSPRTHQCTFFALSHVQDTLLPSRKRHSYEREFGAVAVAVAVTEVALVRLQIPSQVAKRWRVLRCD